MDPEQPSALAAPTKVTVGVFAHDEAANITSAIEQLAAIDFTGCEATVFILANGCTDRTVPMAKALIDGLGPLPANVRFEIIELALGDKSNTWNVYVDEALALDAELLVFCDCDIRFGSDRTVRDLFELLARTPAASASTSIPVKRVGPGATRFARLAARGPATYDSKTAIAGHLYCLRASFASRFRLPAGMPCEDGFVRALVVTDLFTSQDDVTRIAAHDAISHTFEPVATIREWHRHERRIIVGTTINYFLFKILWARVGSTEADAGEVLRSLASGSSSWLGDLVDHEAQRQLWVVPKEYISRRFTNPDGSRISLKSLPKRVAMTVLDWAAAIGANRILRGGKAVGHW